MAAYYEASQRGCSCNESFNWYKKNVYIVYGKRRFLSSVETVMSAITSLCVIKCIISSSLYNKFKMPGIFSSFLSVVVSFISVYFRWHGTSPERAVVCLHRHILNSLSNHQVKQKRRGEPCALQITETLLRNLTRA